MNAELLISNDLNLKKKGGLYFCFSGTHKDTNPSMSFWKKGNKFHCFACGFNYDINDHKRGGYKVKQVTLEQNTVTNYSQPRHCDNFKPIGKYINNYFKRRKIDLNTFSYLNLREHNYYKIIVYPIFNEFGTHITNKFRNVETKEIYFEKNTNCKTLYNINNVEKGRPIFITEGESDLFSCLTAFNKTNFKNFVSLVTGANSKLTPSIINYLKNFPEVVLCFDNDDAGRDSQNKITNLLNSENIKCSCLKWDNIPYKDLNEILVNLGEKFFVNFLINSCKFRKK